MGRKYSITAAVSGVTANTTKDLLEIIAPSDGVVIVHEIHVTNDSDETSEMIPLSISRFATSGSGGSAITPAPLDAGDTAFAGTVEAGNTTIASSTETVLWRQAENILNGWHFVPVPEGRIVVKPSASLVVKLLADPTPTAFSINAVIEEIGS